MEAAARVFTLRGFHRTTTNAVAERAGVSVGSLYQYFPDKVALLVAVRDRELSALMNQLTRACVRPAASLEAALHAIVAAAAEHHRVRAPLVRLFSRHLTANPEARPLPPLAFHGALRQLLLAHAAELRISDHELGLFVLRNLGRSLLQAAVESRPADLANGVIVREVVASALAFLTGRPGEGSSAAAMSRQRGARAIR